MLSSLYILTHVKVNVHSSNFEVRSKNETFPNLKSRGIMCNLTLNSNCFFGPGKKKKERKNELHTCKCSNF